MNVVQRVVELGVFLEIEGRALDQFYERNDGVVVPSLIKAGEVLKLSFHWLAALLPLKGIFGLQYVIYVGESINTFVNMVFKYFRVH